MEHVFIIAEAGVNHNGSAELARKLVLVAAEAGADAVKFQTFKSERVVTNSAGKAGYQKITTGSKESQLEMLRKLELPVELHLELRDLCKQNGIEFLSTPFDEESMEFLVSICGMTRLKIPSGEITNPLILLQAARTGLPLILSTGMATLGEVETALGILAFGLTTQKNPPSQMAFSQAFFSVSGQQALRDRVTLLHCTTEYPTLFDEVNLRAMDSLRQAFGLPVGLSDHTPGISIPIASAAREAVVVEKHFTLDRNLPGPDHLASLEPKELRAMVEGIRAVESALGSGVKLPTPVELENRLVARRSLVTLRPVARGEMFTAENLCCKRPGSGVSALFYWEYLGRISHRDYGVDELVEAS
ncbi:MAG: N-acetylneuraminate synthase [Candidatus Ozemobacteraceae bacterium]